MRVTIKHIAKAANVSHTTVSRVFHNDTRISEATRKRVIEVAKRLNYRPNIMARGLVQHQTFLIGLIVPDIISSFFPVIIEGIEGITNQKHYSIILCTSEGDVEREREHVLSLLNKGADGMIITPVNGSDIEKMDKLAALDETPVIFLAGPKANCTGNFVSVNDRQIGFMAVEYLFKLGHRRIGFLAGEEHFEQSKFRKEGYLQAMKKFGLEIIEEYIIPSGYTIEKGYASGKKLAALKKLPTAVYAVSDPTAIGAIEALQNAGLSIPGDISIIGTDDLQVAALIRPKLTTIAQPKRKIGEIAARLLIDVIEGKKIKNIELETKMVIRDSVAKPKH